MVDHKTPWTVEPDMRSEWVDHRREFSGEEYCAGFNILDAEGGEVVGVEGITDADDTRAAFIVKAVNHHAQLVEALRGCIDRMDGEYGFDGPELDAARKTLEGL